MNSYAKLVIGLVILVVGIYWYAGPLLGQFDTILGVRPTKAFVETFVGTFGLALILLGLIVAWIEMEDIKWERKEKGKKKQS